MPQYQESDCSGNVCVPKEGNTGCRPCSDEAQQLLRANAKSGAFRMDFQLQDDANVLASDQGRRSQPISRQQTERLPQAERVQPQLDRTQQIDASDCELSGGCQPRGGMPRNGINGYGPSYPDYFPQRWNTPQNNVGQQMLHSLLYSAMRTQFNDPRYNQIFNPGINQYDPRFQPGRYDPRYQPGGWDQSYDQRFDPRFDQRYQPDYDPRYQPGNIQRYDPRWDQQQVYDPRYQPNYDPRFQPGYDPRYQPGWDQQYDPRYQPNDYVRYQPQWDQRYQPGCTPRYCPGGGGGQYFPGGGGGFYPGGFRPGGCNNNLGQQILFNAVLPMVMSQIGRNQFRNFHHGGGRWYR